LILKEKTPGSADAKKSNLSTRLTTSYRISPGLANRICFLVDEGSLQFDDAKLFAECINVSTKNQDNRKRPLEQTKMFVPQPVPIHSEYTQVEAEKAEQMLAILRQVG
jgi:hypothetical protein